MRKLSLSLTVSLGLLSLPFLLLLSIVVRIVDDCNLPLTVVALIFIYIYILFDVVSRRAITNIWQVRRPQALFCVVFLLNNHCYTSLQVQCAYDYCLTTIVYFFFPNGIYLYGAVLNGTAGFQQHCRRLWCQYGRVSRDLLRFKG